MAKRKESNTFGVKISDTMTPAGGENDIPAEELRSGVETAGLPRPAAMPVRDAQMETSPGRIIIRARVEELVKNRSLLAAGMGLVPVPVFNIVSTAAIQVSMVQSITRLYNVEVKKSWIKNVITSALGGLGSAALSGTAAKSLGAAPLVGVSLAALSAPAMNGLTTYAIGYMFIRYFESPEGFLKANTRALREWFAEGFKDGRKKLGGVIAGNARTNGL
ncbi:MAG: YcjF family protein [Treponema sp.]|jgi:uncharacterized protein (DUF697 family)|nr:YcjF family protein [Treponema sp.]